ncbi:uncharacterized protein [Asterias amurensis]|uniref:uncharacterized protein n=1 Tax=Asterias amurensis TaxID=7602 RepID=UPI003AB61357
MEIALSNAHNNALKWLQSYFTNRSQSVVIGDQISSNQFPRGSVMGHSIFTLYSSPLEDVIKSHGMSYTMYADDTQVYTILNHNTQSTIIPKLEACLNDIKVWSSRNGLKLNQQKTEFLHLSSKFRSKSSLQPITIADSSLDPTSHARDLGVIIDDQLTMAKHVSNLCRASSFGLHKNGKIRQYLDQSTTEKLIHAFVMSRIDNNNSLLYGLPECQLHKLQRVQNSAARLITRTRSLEPITPILRNLHWLPVKSRIVFKLLTLTYKCKNGSAPDYLQDLIQHYHPPRKLRSS